MTIYVGVTSLSGKKIARKMAFVSSPVKSNPKLFWLADKVGINDTPIFLLPVDCSKTVMITEL